MDFHPSDQLRAVLASIPQITHTRSLLGETLPKATIDVDAQSASLAGLTPRQIATQVQMSLDGQLAVAISGGVVGATLLAIVFAPAAYQMVYCGQSNP
jgi:multidrug efflux pump subunit AcrB